MSDSISSGPSRNPRLITGPDKRRLTLAVDKLGLLVAGGVVVGLAAGLMLPRSHRGALSPQARTALGIVGEVGLALVIRSLDQALQQAQVEAAGEALETQTANKVASPAPSARLTDWRGAAGIVLRAWRKRAKG